LRAANRRCYALRASDDRQGVEGPPPPSSRGAALNIAAFVASLNPFDLLVAFALFGLFVRGFHPGTIRRLLGIGAIIFSFLVAANVRQPLGGFLAANWTQLEDSYAVMIGFGTVFIAASVAFTVLIQTIYMKAPRSGSTWWWTS